MMNLFEVALDYALLHTPAWGRLMVCQRGGEGFGYRLHAKVPVISVPSAPADPVNLSRLAWLFGRHAVRVDGPASIDPASDAWKEAESIFTDLCLLSDQPADASVFEQQRAAVLGPVSTAVH